MNAKAAADKQAAAWELVTELQSKLPLPLFTVGNRIIGLPLYYGGQLLIAWSIS